MISIRFRDRELADFAASVGAIDQRAVDIMDVILADFAGHLSEASPVGVFGHLAVSWLDNFGVRVEGASIVGQVASVGYGAAVNFGTGPIPNFPGYRTLIPWVEKKLGLGGTDARTVAYFISEKIRRKGINAQHFVEATWDKHSEHYAELFAGAVSP